MNKQMSWGIVFGVFFHESTHIKILTRLMSHIGFFLFFPHLFSFDRWDVQVVLVLIKIYTHLN